MLLTFAHVAVSGDGAPLAGALAGSAGRQADETNAFLEIGFAVKFEDGDVVV